jgi:uncharacterized membrane-anchored protein YitT (DUF2179 family)
MMFDSKVSEKAMKFIAVSLLVCGLCLLDGTILTEAVPIDPVDKSILYDWLSYVLLNILLCYFHPTSFGKRNTCSVLLGR